MYYLAVRAWRAAERRASASAAAAAFRSSRRRRGRRRGAVGEGLDGREGHGGEHQHPASSCHDARTGARPACAAAAAGRDPAATAAGGAGERRRRRSGGGIGGTHLSASRRLIAKGEREEVGRTRGAMLITSRCTVLARGIFCAGGSTV